MLKLSHSKYCSFSGELRSLWQKVYERDSSATYFQSYENNARCIAINNVNDIHVYVVFNEGIPLAIIPLEQTFRLGFNVGRFIGHDFNDINDLLIVEGYIGIVYNYLSKISLGFDLVFLNNTRRAIWGAIGHKYMPILCDDTLRLYYEYNKKGGLKKKVKQDIERQIRRLSKLGVLEYRQIHLDEYESFLNDLVFHKRRRYAETKVKDALIHTDLVRHLKGLKKFSEGLSCSVLTLNNNYIAGSIGFISKDVYQYYMPSFDNELSVYSPSKVHLYFELNYQQEDNGMNVFDFTVGREKYKQDWINSMEPISSVLVPQTLKGVILAYFIRARRAVFASRIIGMLKPFLR